MRHLNRNDLETAHPGYSKLNHYQRYLIELGFVNFLERKKQGDKEDALRQAWKDSYKRPRTRKNSYKQPKRFVC